MKTDCTCRKWICLLLFALMGWYGCTGSKISLTGKNLAEKDDLTEGPRNVIQGFKGNIVEPNVIAATISGGGSLGVPNRVNANMGSIGGGLDNQAGELGTVCGGSANAATGFRAFVGGGAQNTADRDSTTIGGGYGNAANGSHATVAGGVFNTATEVDATVSGGSGNKAQERHSTVGGGSINTAAGFGGTVAGGLYNKALGTYTTVSGGISNTSSSIGATVGGGAGNVVKGEEGTVSGGMNNHVSDSYGTTSGGRGNIAGNSNEDPKDAVYATVSGGTENVARGSYSVVPGGSSNLAGGDYSFAAGHRAIVHTEHRGTFLYADSIGTDFTSEAANEFAVRATGGFRFITATDGTGAPSAGTRLLPGSGSWDSFSDRNGKTSFATVDTSQILEDLSKLPVTTWNYKGEMPPVRHLGPTAQDFYETFGLGNDARYISTVDADGVAFAAIQELYDQLKRKEADIEAQQEYIGLIEASIIVLRDQIVSLEGRLVELEKEMKVSKKP